MLARKRVRFSKLPPYVPGRGPRAEQLVPEVAVAVLDVDEGEARLARAHRRGDEVVDQPIELVVGEDRPIVGDADARVEDRVAIGDARRRSRRASASRTGPSA